MKKLILFFAIVLIGKICFAQSSEINPNQGISVPQFTTAFIDGMTNQPKGTVVFDSDLNVMKYYNGTSWQTMSAGGVGYEWTTNGIDILNTNAGNVGVGTGTPKVKFDVVSPNITNAIFGSSSTGISLQQNWPTIGFNQYRDETNVQRYIGSGYAAGNTVDPTTGTMHWTSIPNGDAGNPTPLETTVMSLSTLGRLSINGLTAPANGIIVDGSTNISPIVSNSASDGALRIYSPMTGQSFSGSQFMDIDKDAIQSRKVGVFPNFTKTEQNLRLNPYGGNVGVGTADNTISATLLVHKSPSSSFGTAVFKGTTHYSHFHFGTNEDTYIRGGKNGSNVVLSDVEGTGKVGIGVYPSLYKLEVNGTARAKEVIVETGWADYVFDKDYQLKSIDDLEAFVKQNKHLPNIPKASEIESNGLKVGETNKAMMEKIEELALYIIQLKKEIDVLKAKN
jgi:hypothetical protein